MVLDQDLTPERAHSRHCAYASEMDADALVSSACPTINDLGWVFYFVPETTRRAEELGLDGFRFYFLGRGGVLGDVEAPVVVSAFGYFEPGLVKSMWDSGREVIAPRDAARAFTECCWEYGRRTFSEVSGLDAFCAAAGAVNDAAQVPGLSLYAGIKSEPLADDLPARAMQLVSVLRELRGSAHLLSVVAKGLDPKVAHLIKRPDMVEMFGWRTEDLPEPTARDRELVAEAEALTDSLVKPAFSVLDESGAEDLLTGLDRLAGAQKRAAAG